MRSCDTCGSDRCKCPPTPAAEQKARLEAALREIELYAKTEAATNREIGMPDADEWQEVARMAGAALAGLSPEPSGAPPEEKRGGKGER